MSGPGGGPAALAFEPAIEPAGEPDQAATKTLVFTTAERLFALHGLKTVSVRDITAAAGVNLAAVNYHFRSKDALLLAIFLKRASELNRTRARLLHEAQDRHGGRPPVSEIIEALIGPPVRWLDPQGDRLIAIQFLIRARSEGTEEIKAVLRSDVSHLRRFTEALQLACPHLSAEDICWRLHFVLGMVHNCRFPELERLQTLSDGAARIDDFEALIHRMTAFAEAGFLA